MLHRIREVMRNDDPVSFDNDGGVEVDEILIGRDNSKPVTRGYPHKYKILALADRETGKSRMIVVDDLKMKTLIPILKANIAQEATILR